MRTRLKASYTIEASLIFPFIMGVIVFIIYISFFLHDRAVMKSCAYQAALKGSLVRTSISDMAAEARKAAEYNIEGLLLMTEGLQTDVSVSGKEVTVSYSGTLRIPQGILFMNIAGTEYIAVKGEGRASQKDAIEFIRRCRSAGNVIKRVTK
ncbi:MAG: pilus assembly protein [Lachnospiraceae bacterium]|nr:pilus assembly protein [Lachnospiraceae bacterium]